MIMVVSSLFFFAGGVSFCLNRKHLLLMLLSLEFIVLSLYYIMYLFLVCFGYEFYFGMVFLTMSVCEGALGLSILVSLMRTHGSDCFKGFSILW